MRPTALVLLFLAAAGVACSSWTASDPTPQTNPDAPTAFVGARVIDGSGRPPLDNGVILVQGGKIVAVGASAASLPAGTRRVDLAGRTIIPGMINAHGHVNDVRGLKSSPEFYTREHVEHQLRLQARYGVTTVFSLGGDGPAGIAVRDGQRTGALEMSRLFVAGPIVTAAAPDAARRAVDELAAMKVDIVKIRVDDQLGTQAKMPVETYTAVIDQAHQQGLKVAVHIVTLDDAKGVLRAGADLIAHSVRDRPVDDELVKLLTARSVCVSPTLMREVSTFVYKSRPAFFDDPFFRREVDPATITALEQPAYQASIRGSSAAQWYEKQFGVAKANLASLARSGVRIAFGTDTGPAGRFQGYFEHLELEQMVDAGLTPMQAIVSATADAARCMNVADRIGTLTPGLEADFLVLARNPLEDIRHTRTLESVWIRGARVPEGAQQASRR